MPIDPMLAGAALFAAGALCGRFWPARRRTPKVKAVKPICGCSHHHSFHDPKTGACNAGVKGKGSPILDGKGNPVLDYYGDVQTTKEWFPCACKQYSGPVPLPEFMAHEVTDA